MFGLGAPTLVTIVAFALFFEMVLFWAAVSLADGPEVRYPKCALAGLLVVATCLPCAALLYFALGLWSVWFNSNNYLLSIGAIVLTVLIFWVLPALLYVPFVPVSVKKGLMVSLLQFLLRIFLVVLVIAVVLVILALRQIVRGGGGEAPKAAAPASSPSVVLVSRLP
jgi:hypothetical protein